MRTFVDGDSDVTGGYQLHYLHESMTIPEASIPSCRIYITTLTSSLGSVDTSAAVFRGRDEETSVRRRRSPVVGTSYSHVIPVPAKIDSGLFLSQEHRRSDEVSIPCRYGW